MSSQKVSQNQHTKIAMTLPQPFINIESIPNQGKSIGSKEVEKEEIDENKIQLFDMR